jgi:hypothetical protein
MGPRHRIEQLPIHESMQITRNRSSMIALVTLLGIPANACDGTAQSDVEPSRTEQSVAEVPQERALFLSAARAAWAFVERNYVEATGLVKAHETYRYVTVWDIGSMLAAYHSAYALEIIDKGEFDRRTSRLLATMGELSLFDGVAYNKLYDAQTGRAVDRDETPSTRGYGWSVLDLGRLLALLKVIQTNHPQHAMAAAAVVARMDLDQLVRDGYLIGRDVDPQTREVRSYQEGKIGYEQYAAEAFALWGARAEKALSFSENAIPVEVMGVTVWADRRGDDKLTSEAFILMGLELGWRSPEWREAAWRVLAAQEARYDATGQITMVSEDALPVPPYYFYYYTVYDNGDVFGVSAPGAGNLGEPRWISTKAAFGWHALLPGAYTWKALQAVAPAGDARRGWSAGIFEGNGRSTGSRNMNTAAVVLESALYHSRGRPLLDY